MRFLLQFVVFCGFLGLPPPQLYISHLVVGLLPWNKMCYFHVIQRHSVEYIYYSTLKCGIIVLFHTKALNNKYIPHYSVK